MQRLKAKESDLLEALSLTFKNQKAFDKFYYYILGFNLEEFSGIPRPSKWLNKNQKITKAIKKLSPMLKLLWANFFSYIYFLLRCINYVSKKSRKKPPIDKKSIRTVALAVCDRSFDVISQGIDSQNAIYWLELPVGSLSQNRKMGDKNFIDCLSLLSIIDIVWATIASFRTHFFIRERYGDVLAMQTYTTLDWILLLLAIDKISPNKLITSEHHDRWAILADFYCTLTLQQDKPTNLTLIQHGKEHNQTYEVMLEKFACAELPYRLKNISELFVYDKEQLEIFKRNIIDTSCTTKNDFVVKYFNHKISFFETGVTGTKVLFIGHPACEDLQIFLYNEVSERTGFKFMFKPHPAAKNSSRAAEAGWVFVEETNGYPLVDLLISYPSTLVDEYKHIGIEAFVHPLKSEAKDYTKISENLNYFLDSKSKICTVKNK